MERARKIEIDLHDEDRTRTTVLVIAPEDNIASKLLAARKKDLAYIKSSITTSLIDPQKLASSIADLPIPFEDVNRLLARYDGLVRNTGARETGDGRQPDNLSTPPLPHIESKKVSEDVQAKEAALRPGNERRRTDPTHSPPR